MPCKLFLNWDKGVKEKCWGGGDEEAAKEVTHVESVHALEEISPG